MRTELAELRDRAARRVLAALPVARGGRVAFNPAGWARTEWLRDGDGWRRVELPPAGWRVLDDAPVEAAPRVIATPRRLANDHIDLRFDRAGRLVRLLDRTSGHELVPAGAAGNDLVVFPDTGDAWDFPHNYLLTPPARPACAGASAAIDGPEARLVLQWRHGDSTFTQTWTLRAGERRAACHLAGDWRTPGSMLRVRFPVAVRAVDATCGIQFGHLRRPTHANTTWDLAKDEVPCQGWADLSQRDHGLALLAVAKYGFRVKDGVLDLNLLRSVPYPNVSDLSPDQLDAAGRAFTDLGPFACTFALYPHAGDAVAGGVAREHALLDEPPFVLTAGRRGAGSLPASAAAVDPGSPQVLLAAVKRAEDDDGIIVRLVEIDGAACQTTLRTCLPCRTAQETDLLERPRRRLRSRAGAIPLAFRPFEIKTLRLR
jgi:alpha-mannosidase